MVDVSGSWSIDPGESSARAFLVAGSYNLRFFESVPAFEDALQGVRCLVNVPGVKVVLGTRLWEFSKRDALVGFRRFISEMRRWSVKHLGDLDRPVPVAVVPDWSRFQADAFIDDRPHEACM
ncbi:hypothetical protein FOZ62_012029 [Perkinsus olseni]|uniref:Uncharacterized protein n=1 Tax=Perkinsus olseni TaxID=32597 RepID=A0A7J6SG84_PEROL|nr:hypothetical protein FOZ62_012029 [Perkinsus olseni]